jgi:hypothetical protein
VGKELQPRAAGPVPPRNPLTEEQKDQVKQVNRFVLGFGATALTAMLGLTLQFPWSVVGVAATVVAVPVAVKGILLARRADLTKAAVTYLGIGLGLIALFALYSVPLIVTWPDQWRYSQCIDMTQTITGQDACLKEFENATETGWKKLLNLGD